MILDLIYDGLRKTTSKTEQSKIDGSKVNECQRNRPMQEILDNAPKPKSPQKTKRPKK